MQISSLTVGDNVTLTASFYYVNDDKFQCEHKISEYAKREGQERAKLRVSKENGCGVIREDYRYDIDGIRYHQCVCDYKDSSISFYTDILNRFESGVMPFPGSYLEQPAKIVEIIQRMARLKADYLEQEMKKRELNGS